MTTIRDFIAVIVIGCGSSSMAGAQDFSHPPSNFWELVSSVPAGVESPTTVPTSRLQSPNAEELFQQAKLAMFDKDWQQALRKLRELQSRFASSPLTHQAIFYEATALENLNQKEEALRKYEAFIGRVEPDSPLREQAQYSIIGLSTDLYIDGKTAYIDRALKALKDNRNSVRYYAALRLSYVKDRKIANQSVPVLQEVLRTEKDPELRDRASIAIIRIDPKLLEKENVAQPSSRGQWLKLTIIEDGEEAVNLTLPLSLARLLLQSLPSDIRRDLEREGVRPESILDALEKLAPGELFELKTRDSLIRIRIE